MRNIFYIPKDKDINDYKSEWFNKFPEVHHGLSDNIKEYISDPSIAQEVLIPEYSGIMAPQSIGNVEFFQIEYFNDFESIKQEKSFVELEIWSKDLDDPSKEEVLVDKKPFHYEVGRRCFITDHFKLDVGWYDFVVKVDGEQTELKECSVYEVILEEE